MHELAHLLRIRDHVEVVVAVVAAAAAAAANSEYRIRELVKAAAYLQDMDEAIEEAKGGMAASVPVEAKEGWVAEAVGKVEKNSENKHRTFAQTPPAHR